MRNPSTSYRTIKKFLRSTTFLTIGVPVLGLIIYATASVLRDQVFKLPPSVIFNDVGTVFLSLVLLLSSIFVMIRQESPRPGLQSVKGWPAVVIDIIGTLFWGVLTILSIYQLLSHLMLNKP
ncbi:MAG TPA: hypothetical protein PLT26_06060 [Anaerolineaceae bacterium]|jgi:hypothetical protein|nr:hypothetical protein [Anaerolineaceae bacterium]HQH85277.1 hypothetical protein [Anaerolineaceae bacterium]